MSRKLLASAILLTLVGCSDEPKELTLQLTDNATIEKTEVVAAAAEAALNACGVHEYIGEVTAINATWLNPATAFSQEHGWYEAVRLEAVFDNGEHCYYEVGEGVEPGVETSKQFCVNKCGGRSFTPLVGGEIVRMNVSNVIERQQQDAALQAMFEWPETFNGSWHEANNLSVSLRNPLPELTPFADRICTKLQESGIQRHVDIALQDSDAVHVNETTKEFEVDTIATLSCENGSATALNI